MSKTDTGTQEEQAPLNPPVPSSGASSSENKKVFPVKLEDESATAYTAFQKWIADGGGSRPDSVQADRQRASQPEPPSHEHSALLTLHFCSPVVP